MEIDKNRNNYLIISETPEGTIHLQMGSALFPDKRKLSSMDYSEKLLEIFNRYIDNLEVTREIAKRIIYNTGFSLTSETLMDYSRKLNLLIDKPLSEVSGELEKIINEIKQGGSE
ncbi:MAG: hypothetical protein KKC19_03890 [Nanoarchaeota archaeon]|nr:hypothetical protein [Nanoarchaeota archaeon]